MPGRIGVSLSEAVSMANDLAVHTAFLYAGENPNILNKMKKNLVLLKML